MKLIRPLLIGVLVIILVGALSFVGWATLSAQDATPRALSVLQENHVQREDRQLVFQPDVPTNQGLILYPGGLVEPEAYAVIAQGIADAGVLVVVPKMPLNLAFMGINRADRIRADFPEIESWAIGGHSLGGAMAAEYAKNNVEDIEGLVMLASYPANDEEFANSPIPILTIIASEDPGSPRQEEFYSVLGDSGTRALIEGGNHRQFADYSFQKGDGIATISAQDQQEQIIAATVQFLDALDEPTAQPSPTSLIQQPITFSLQTDAVFQPILPEPRPKETSVDESAYLRIDERWQIGYTRAKL